MENLIQTPHPSTLYARLYKNFMENILEKLNQSSDNFIERMQSKYNKSSHYLEIDEYPAMYHTDAPRYPNNTYKQEENLAISLGEADYNEAIQILQMKDKYLTDGNKLRKALKQLSLKCVLASNNNLISDILFLACLPDFILEDKDLLHKAGISNELIKEMVENKLDHINEATLEEFKSQFSIQELTDLMYEYYALDFLADF